MQLNYQLLKDILLFIERESNGYKYFILMQDDIANGFPNYKIPEVRYHFGILGDDQLIHGYKDNSRLPTFDRLTAEGHRVLEAMKNDGLWHKIKDEVIDAGINGLKQIPALAIGAMLKIM